VNRRIHTPWGESQTVREIAEGITLVTTAGHGGYLLSPARRSAMPDALHAFETFAGGNAYEEDCDWAVVAVAFPEHFDALSVLYAVHTIEGGADRYFSDVVDHIPARARAKANLAECAV
jgi:hypothetical protein